MSMMNKVRWAIIVAWGICAGLVLFEVMNPFSEKMLTFLACLLFIDNVAKSMDKEKI